MLELKSQKTEDRTKFIHQTAATVLMMMTDKTGVTTTLLYDQGWVELGLTFRFYQNRSNFSISIPSFDT